MRYRSYHQHSQTHPQNSIQEESS